MHVLVCVLFDALILRTWFYCVCDTLFLDWYWYLCTVVTERRYNGDGFFAAKKLIA